MREKKRIDRIIKKIDEAWNRNPDMRFLQLLINLCIIPDGNMWNVEDNKIEEILKENPNSI